MGLGLERLLDERFWAQLVSWSIDDLRLGRYGMSVIVVVPSIIHYTRRNVSAGRVIEKTVNL